MSDRIRITSDWIGAKTSTVTPEIQEILNRISNIQKEIEAISQDFKTYLESLQ